MTGNFHLDKMTTYSNNTKNTWPMQHIRYKSTAFKLSDTGASVFAPLKILIRTKNIVTSNPILPGTQSGLIKKDAHETITNKKDMR